MVGFNKLPNKTGKLKLKTIEQRPGCWKYAISIGCKVVLSEREYTSHVNCLQAGQQFLCSLGHKVRDNYRCACLDDHGFIADEVGSRPITPTPHKR